MKKQILLLFTFAITQGILGMEKKDLSEKLNYAIASGRLLEVESLLNAGADINPTLEQKQLSSSEKSNQLEKLLPPLANAARNSSPEMVKLLLEHSADVGARSPSVRSEGWTPLMHALMNLNEENSERIIDILLQYHVDINAKNSDGDTAILIAASSSIKNNLLKLLNHNADAKIANNTGVTPLMVAAKLHWQFEPLERVEAILTVISDHDVQEIRKNWDKMLSLRFGQSAQMNLDIRKRLIGELFQSIVQDRIDRALFLMNQKDNSGKTASQLAENEGLKALLDPNNQDSIKQIRALIVANVKRALFGQKPEVAK